MFTTTFEIKPNTVGFLYRNFALERELAAGVHKINTLFATFNVIVLPITPRLITITNQEVLSKDNIAFRFSFYVLYKVADGKKLLSQFPHDELSTGRLSTLEERLSSYAQIHVRSKISGIESETINDKRDSLFEAGHEELTAQFESLGIELESVQLRDVTFPKSIQDLFAKQLEAKIRARTDLENARSTVATARTLKNASELMKGDENVKFIQWLETIGKIAERGKHTFMIGNVAHLANS